MCVIKKKNKETGQMRAKVAVTEPPPKKKKRKEKKMYQYQMRVMK